MATSRQPGRPRRSPAAHRPARTPTTPQPATTPGDGPAPAPAPATTPEPDRALMRARLAAMATPPRESDSPRMAALRAILRDQALMAHVTANVDQWPPLSDEQARTLAALLHTPASHPRRRAALSPPHGPRTGARSRRAYPASAAAGGLPSPCSGEMLTRPGRTPGPGGSGQDRHRGQPVDEQPLVRQPQPIPAATGRARR